MYDIVYRVKHLSFYMNIIIKIEIIFTNSLKIYKINSWVYDIDFQTLWNIYLFINFHETFNKLYIFNNF